VISLFGYLAADYPAHGALPFNRAQLAPWWGAWEPAILAGTGLLAALALMLSWTALATLYCLPVWVIVFFSKSRFEFAAKLAAGRRGLDARSFVSDRRPAFVWLRLAGFDPARRGFGLHFVIGWIYLFLGPMFLPRDPDAPKVKADPFADSKALERKSRQSFFPSGRARK